MIHAVLYDQCMNDRVSDNAMAYDKHDILGTYNCRLYRTIPNYNYLRQFRVRLGTYMVSKILKKLHHNILDALFISVLYLFQLILHINAGTGL